MVYLIAGLTEKENIEIKNTISEAIQTCYSS